MYSQKWSQLVSCRDSNEILEYEVSLPSALEGEEDEDLVSLGKGSILP
jgi:hypothetical protein